jgi:hypothetical protein
MPAPSLINVVLWPLRKVAIVPAVTIGGFFFAAYLGSAELSANATRAIFGSVRKEDSQPGTQLVATAGALSISCAFAVVREYFFRPKVVLPPTFPEKAEGMAYLHARASLWAHYVRHYPYSYRAKTVFAAGSIAGVCYTALENRWNAGNKRPAASSPTRTTAGGSAHASHEVPPPLPQEAEGMLASVGHATAHALAAASSTAAIAAAAVADDFSHHRGAPHSKKQNSSEFQQQQELHEHYGDRAGELGGHEQQQQQQHLPRDQAGGMTQEFRPHETALRLAQAITERDSVPPR